MKLRLSILALAVGCSSATAVPLDQTFQVRLGETASITSANVSVRPDTVTEDSRCPIGAQCVWAGNAKVRLVMHAGGRDTTVALNTTLDPKTATFGGYVLELVSEIGRASCRER